MSRIGRAPIEIPAGVEVACNGTLVTVKGPKGTLTHNVHPDMTVTVEGNTIHVTRPQCLFAVLIAVRIGNSSSSGPKRRPAFCQTILLQLILYSVPRH